MSDDAQAPDLAVQPEPRLGTTCEQRLGLQARVLERVAGDVTDLPLDGDGFARPRLRVCVTHTIPFEPRRFNHTVFRSRERTSDAPVRGGGSRPVSLPPGRPEPSVPGVADG